MTTNPNPRVGVTAIIVKQNKYVLIGKRKGSHGAETIQTPGGHLEFGESWEQCAAREIAEETDLKIKNITFFHATNDVFVKENKHYITIFMKAVMEDETQEPKVMEPHKCDYWMWIDWNELLEKQNEFELFLPMQNLFAQKDVCARLL